MTFIPLLIAYFLSGFSAISYQLLWVRQLTLAFGHTTLALSAVLSAFMLGLAGGSWLGGKAVKISSPRKGLLIFACVEITLGAMTSISKPLFGKIPILLASFLSFSLPTGVLHLIYFLSALLILAPPAILMGMTFPLIVHAVKDEPGNRFRNSLGWIYGVNTAGAVVGALMVGFFVVSHIGISLTYLMASCLNITAGLLGWRMSRYYSDETAPLDSSDKGSISNPFFTLPSALLFLTGFSSMMIEVSWTRAFSLIIGSSTYAYSIILITFLLGLAGGGMFFGWAQSRMVIKKKWMAIFFLVLGMSIIMNLPLFNHLPYYYVRLFPISVQRMAFLNFVQFLLCLLVMGGPTFLLGISFSWILSEAPSLSVGSLTAANTLGCLLGSAITGLLLIPRIGSEKTLLIAGGLLTLCALVVVLTSKLDSKLIRLGTVFGIVFIGLAAFFRANWNPYVMTSGVFLYAPQYLSFPNFKSWEKSLRQNALLFYRDGVASNVSVFEMPVGSRFLRINGKTDASSNSDMLTQLLSGYLPEIFYKGNPASALAIGLGSGVSLGALTTSPTLKSITAVEIEPAVAEAQSWFSDINRNAIKDSRVKMIYSDARHFLNVDRGHYDIITSEPSNPWMAGVSSLYTKEAFTAGRDRLTANGVFCQWFHSYAMGERDFRMIVHTFVSVFPHAMMFTTGEDDFFLLGSREPIQMDYRELEVKFKDNPAMQADMTAVNLGTPFSMLSVTFLLESDDLKTYSQEAPIHVDDKPILEHSAPRYLYRGESRQIYEGVFRSRTHSFPRAVTGFHPSTAEKINLLNLTAEAFLSRRLPEAAFSFIDEAKKMDDRNARTWSNWARILNARDQDLKAEEAYRKALAINPKLPLPWFHLGMMYRDQGMQEKSQHSFEEGLKRAPGDPMATMALAEIYVEQSRHAEAKKLLLAALDKTIRDPVVVSRLRQYLSTLGQRDNTPLR